MNAFRHLAVSCLAEALSFADDSGEDRCRVLQTLQVFAEDPGPSIPVFSEHFKDVDHNINLIFQKLKFVDLLIMFFVCVCRLSLHCSFKKIILFVIDFVKFLLISETLVRSVLMTQLTEIMDRLREKLHFKEVLSDFIFPAFLKSSTDSDSEVIGFLLIDIWDEYAWYLKLQWYS